MENDTGVSTSVADNPYILLALLAVGILGIVLSALNKSTTSVGTWLLSLRRIGADAKAADIAARDTQIANLSNDLKNERTARQKDREYFEKEIKRRDDLSRHHISWDWKVYNALVRANLLEGESEGPPPLF